MLLLIDNYDSFVHNLARYFERLGQETIVVRNDAIGPADVRRMRPSAIVLSPGPCTPAEAGSAVSIVCELAASVPMLGVCLGHQTIAAAFGVPIVRAAEPRHGRTSMIHHDQQGLFAGLPTPMTVCRYHSLVIDPQALPEPFRITAYADDGEPMAIANDADRLYGVQFHPEAALTEHGFALLANFLRLAGLPTEAEPEALAASENRSPAKATVAAPIGPVTF